MSIVVDYFDVVEHTLSNAFSYYFIYNLQLYHLAMLTTFIHSKYYKLFYYTNLTFLYKQPLSALQNSYKLTYHQTQ